MPCHLARSAGGEDVADDGEDERDADARAQPLNGAEDNQLDGGLRGTAEHRADQEDDGANDQKPLAAELVRELADDRDHGR